MAYETLIKRTVWVAICPACTWRDVKASNPPREVLCPDCGNWVQYLEESYIGPDLKPIKA